MINIFLILANKYEIIPEIAKTKTLKRFKGLGKSSLKKCQIIQNNFSMFNQTSKD